MTVVSGEVHDARKGGRKEKRMTSSKMDRFHYSGDGCAIGRSERPGWG